MEIKNEIGENNIWISVDETKDTNSRYVVYKSDLYLLVSKQLN